MFGTEIYKIIFKSKKLLKKIEKELSCIKLRDQNISENQKYKLNQILNAKIMPLLINLQLSVRVDIIALIFQLFNSSSI